MQNSFSNSKIFSTCSFHLNRPCSKKCEFCFAWLSETDIVGQFVVKILAVWAWSCIPLWISFASPWLIEGRANISCITISPLLWHILLLAHFPIKLSFFLWSVVFKIFTLDSNSMPLMCCKYLFRAVACRFIYIYGAFRGKACLI